MRMPGADGFDKRGPRARRLCRVRFAFVWTLLGALGGASLMLSACTNPFLTAPKNSVSPPSFSPGGGVFGADQSVSLSAAAGATVYYTTDGSIPTSSSPKYGGPIAVTGNGTNETIKAIAVLDGATSSVVSASFTINFSIGGASVLAAPTFSPSSGVYPTPPAGGVVMSGPSGASIYYTTDGSTPTAAHGTRFTGPIAITGANGDTTTIRAISVESGLISSPVVSATYEINFSQVATPQFSPAAGVSGGDLSGIAITVPSAPSGTDIFYTFTMGSTTGTTPATTAGGATAEYSSNGTVVTPVPPVTGNGTVVTVEAIATAPGYTASTVARATYTIDYSSQTATPVFTPGTGSYSSGQSVTIADATSGATIYYTTNGTAPSYPPSGSTQTYAGTGISVAGNGTVETIEAMAVKSGLANSTIATATITIDYNQVSTPTFSPQAGTYAKDLSSANGNPVALSDATAGATIYYTLTTGSISSPPAAPAPPTTASTAYTGPITVAGNQTEVRIAAIAAKAGLATSGEATATYAVNYGQVPPPTFGVAGGLYPSDQTVTLADAASGATIYYTTNGTAPSYPPSGSTQIYAGTGISVAGSGTGPVQTTIDAIAVEAGMTASAEASASYTISYPADSVTPTISITPSGPTDSRSADGSHITASAAPTITISGGTTATTYWYTYALDGSPAVPTIGGAASATGASTSFSDASYGGGAQSTITVDAFAVDPQTTAGPLAAATFTINAVTATPTFSIAAARYSTSQSLTIADPTSGATVYATVTPDATAVASAPNPASSSSYTTSGLSSTSVMLAGPLQSYAVEAMGAAPGYGDSADIATSAAQPFIIVTPKIIETTPGTQTFTVPAGLSSLSVTAKLWGGGGSGGLTATGAGGTGGGGGFAETTVNGLSSATATTSFSIGVGSGGSAAGTGGAESFFSVTSGGGTPTYEAVAGGGGGGGAGTPPSSDAPAAGQIFSATPTNGGTGGAGGQTAGPSQGVTETLRVVGAPPAIAVYTGAGGGIAGSNGSGGAGGIYGPELGYAGAAGGSGSVATGAAPTGYGGGGGGSGYGGGGSGGSSTLPSSLISIGNGGGGGGGDYGTITEAGSNQTPGNTADADYQSGYAVGGAPQASGTGGLAVIYLN